jgi:mRNA-degrading endonuclease toxin of MazEF toxin-antitoxin module
MQADEIYLGSFPFGDVPWMKLRPVLLLTGPLGTMPEVLVAYISSVFPATMLPTDIVLDPGNSKSAATNLKAKSVLRIHKLATIHASSLVRRLGTLSPAMASEVDRKLRALLNL